MTDIRSNAIERISELLRNQDDLAKVPGLVKQLQREKAAIDVQLKAGVRSQIDVTMRGVNWLGETKQVVEQVRDEMVKIHKLQEESKESIPDFALINRASRIHQNFQETQEFLQNFNNMSNEIEEIEQMMEIDGNFHLTASMPNLLTIHYSLSKLRDVKDNASYYAEKSADDVKRTIAKHFAPLQSVINNFDSLVIEISENLLEIVRSDNSSLVVRLARILDVEEKQDMTAAIVADVSNGPENESSNIRTPRASRISRSSLLLQNVSNSPSKNSSQSMLISKKSHRLPREYLQRFFQAIESSTSQIFDNCYSAFPDDPDQLLENLDWIFTDLGLAKEELDQCMPRRWRIFEKFAAHYHAETHKILDKLLKTEPPAATILNLLNWVKEYYDKMSEGLGIPKDSPLLTPPLLDGKIDALYDEYLDLIVSKLREWQANLATTEQTNFIERSVPPESDPNNKLGMQGEVIMFSIISQQIDVAAESGQGRILLGAVEECARILKARQTSWELTMREQVRLQLQDTSSTNDSNSSLQESAVPGGLVEYLIALANDQIKAADYAEALSSRIAPILSKKYRALIMSAWDSVCDSAITLAKSCIAALIALVFNDVEPALKNIFTSSSWYKGKPIRQIADTILEYTVDCKTHLTSLIYDVFLDDVVEECILRYLLALTNKGVSLKSPKGTDQIKRDLEILYTLFADQYDEDRANEIQDRFRIFDHVLSGLESPLADLPAVWQGLLDDFWDAPRALFEAVVRSRKDVDSKDFKDIMSKIPIETNREVSQGTAQPTFISRFAKRSSY